MRQSLSQSVSQSVSQTDSQTATLHTALYEFHNIAKCRSGPETWNQNASRRSVQQATAAAVSRHCGLLRRTAQPYPATAVSILMLTRLHLILAMQFQQVCLLPLLSTAQGAQQPNGHYRVGCLVLTVATGSLVLYSRHQVFWQPLFCLPQSRQLITKTAFRISPRLILFNPYLSATPTTELVNLIWRCDERKPISFSQIIKPISFIFVINQLDAQTSPLSTCAPDGHL